MEITLYMRLLGKSLVVRNKYTFNASSFPSRENITDSFSALNSESHGADQTREGWLLVRATEVETGH